MDTGWEGITDSNTKYAQYIMTAAMSASKENSTIGDARYEVRIKRDTFSTTAWFGDLMFSANWDWNANYGVRGGSYDSGTTGGIFTSTGSKGSAEPDVYDGTDIVAFRACIPGT